MRYSIFLGALLILGACHSPAPRQYHGRDYVLKTDSARLLADLLTRDVPPVKSLAAFTHYADSLPVSELFSVSLLDHQVRGLLPTLSPAAQDSLYAAYLTRFFRIVYNHSDSIYSTFGAVVDSLNNAEHFNRAAVADFFDLFGMGLYSTEGSYYLDAAPAHLKNVFASATSPCVLRLAVVREKELLEGFSSDAGLIISFDSVYRRAQVWEAIADHCGGPLQSDIASNVQLYRNVLLRGMENTPIFGESGMDEGVRALYGRIAASPDSTRSAQLVREFFTVVRDNNFSNTDAVNAWVSQHTGSLP